jgi:hypothetical protein
MYAAIAPTSTTSTVLATATVMLLVACIQKALEARASR